jgi:hypothetical protein
MKNQFKIHNGDSLELIKTLEQAISDTQSTQIKKINRITISKARVIIWR